MLIDRAMAAGSYPDPASSSLSTENYIVPVPAYLVIPKVYNQVNIIISIIRVIHLKMVIKTGRKAVKVTTDEICQK